MSGVSPDGRWELVFVNTYEVTDAGYGTGAWQYDLVELATRKVVRSWSGTAARSPWQESSHGTRSVAWDGDVLVVLEEDGTEMRLSPDQLSQARSPARHVRGGSA